MELKITNLNALDYRELSDIHEVLKQEIKKSNHQIAAFKQKPISQLTKSELADFARYRLLTKVRIQIKEQILSFAETVKLSSLWQ